MEATISLRGWPRSFGHSLVQGYFVEALLSLAAPAAGHVLLPAAAVVSDTGPVLILGPSGAGKSSLSARAIAAGRIVIGDDQVLLDRRAHCTAFPRRMRFYPDLAETAPAAYRALRGSTRTVLLVRGLIDRLTAGYVRPSLVVDPAEVNRGHQLHSGTIRRVLLLEPRAPVAELDVAPCDLPTLLSQARRLFELQRERLWAVAPAAWRTAIEAIADMEEGILRSALEALPLERVQIPAGWPPKRSIDALTELVGIGPQAIGRAG